MSFGVPLGIAGMGLIGGSIALRARHAGIRVIGFDADPSATSLADERAASLGELASRCETLVIALPTDATLDAIDELRRAAVQPRLVLDVASVKGAISQRAGGWHSFVATHPIAGAERGGFGSATADLFHARTWAYVPTGDERDDAVRTFIETMGATPVAVDAAEHDRILALTSHLPQLAVSELGALLEERHVSPALAGPGLASTLRLAGSPWALWETILRANAPAVSEALRDLARRLDAAADALRAGEVERVASTFEGANRAYEQFARGRKT